MLLPSHDLPRDVAEAVIGSPRPPDGRDERFAGYGVMGLPFTSGHYLAFRSFPASSIGAGYMAVWHREPDGRWTFTSDVPPHLSCARYFGPALAGTEMTPIAATWTGPQALRISIGDRLKWEMSMGATAATRIMSAAGRLLPDAAWRSELAVRTMARIAGPLLGVGQVRLAGTAPDGQRFRACPRLIWAITASTASIGGRDLGPPAPLPRQDRLGDFWLPQSGIFVAGTAHFDDYDPARHSALPGLAFQS